MYLDFIADIAKVGDSIHITCQDEIIDGTIVKIAPTTQGAGYIRADRLPEALSRLSH